ncbi:MAG: hypothetical protein ACLR23_28985 [Clostridia bacterium]
MYQSRYHFTNGKMSVAVDSMTGELLELVHAQSGENLIKNSSFQLPQPLYCGESGRKDGDFAPRKCKTDSGRRGTSSEDMAGASPG